MLARAVRVDEAGHNVFFDNARAFASVVVSAILDF